MNRSTSLQCIRDFSHPVSFSRDDVVLPQVGKDIIRRVLRTLQVKVLVFVMLPSPLPFGTIGILFSALIHTTWASASTFLVSVVGERVFSGGQRAAVVGVQ